MTEMDVPGQTLSPGPTDFPLKAKAKEAQSQATAATVNTLKDTRVRISPGRPRVA